MLISFKECLCKNSGISRGTLAEHLKAMFTRSSAFVCSVHISDSVSIAISQNDSDIVEDESIKIGQDSSIKIESETIIL